MYYIFFETYMQIIFKFLGIVLLEFPQNVIKK